MSEQDDYREAQRYAEWQAAQEEHERQSYEQFLEQKIEKLEGLLDRQINRHTEDVVARDQEICELQARLEAGVKLLKDARDAISTLPKNCFGDVPDTPTSEGWWIRDEFLDKISKGIAALQEGEGE